MTRLNNHRNDARSNADHDGLRNVAEFRAHTDPRDSDTDTDGIRDGREQAGTVVSLTRVHEARLSVTSAGRVFTKIELG